MDNIHAATISNCVGGSIIQTEYWNMRQNNSQYYGYWHNENLVKGYLRLELNGSLFVSLKFSYLQLFQKLKQSPLAPRESKIRLEESMIIVSLTLKRLRAGSQHDLPCVFSKNASSKERVKPLFYVTFNIIITDIFPANFIEIPQAVQRT